MQRRRSRPGLGLAGFGALVLFVATLLPWFDRVPHQTGPFGGESSLSAWEVFSGLDLLIFLIALVTLLIVIVAAARSARAVLPYVVLLGWSALAMTIYGVVEVKTAAGPLQDASEGGFRTGRIEIGVLLAALAAGAMIVGVVIAWTSPPPESTRPG